MIERLLGGLSYFKILYVSNLNLKLTLKFNQNVLHMRKTRTSSASNIQRNKKGEEEKKKKIENFPLSL